MITKIKIEMAQLGVKKWKDICAKYRAGGHEPPPFARLQLEAAQKKLNEMTPQQAALL